MRKQRNPKLGAEAQSALDLTRERQDYGEAIIRMSEYSSSSPLSDMQREVLLRGDTDFLGLTLVPQLSGAPYLKASHVVGSARFVHGRSSVTVHVEPKVGSANFLRMLDHTCGLSQVDRRPTEVGVGETNPTALFLRFFAEQVQSFLQQQRYRSYSFATSATANLVKGRPLVGDYLTGSLPRAKPHVLPCRYLEFSADILENQIIALAVHTATQLASLLPSNSGLRRDLIRRLRSCDRLLTGVSIRRITAAEIARIRYTRVNEHFKPLHRLCEMIVRRCSISLKPGEKLPFISFAIGMPELFQSYASAVFSAAFGGDFTGNRSRLKFLLDVVDKPIYLDGLLRYRGQSVVIECKYKDITPQGEARPDADDYSLLGGRIQGADLYQTVAYTSHTHVRAAAGLLVYPSWEANAPPIAITRPIEAFGWRTGTASGVPIYLVGLNLASNFGDAVRMLKGVMDGLPRP